MSGNINFNGWINDDGSENYKCRAWVNFNGTGTVAIRASGNVSSITDRGTGDYTVNFTTAMPNTNYSVSGSALNSDAFANFGRIVTLSAASASDSPTTTSFKITTSFAESGAKNDCFIVGCIVFC